MRKPGTRKLVYDKARRTIVIKSHMTKALVDRGSDQDTANQIGTWIWDHFGSAYWEYYGPDQQTGGDGMYMIGMFDGSPEGRRGFGATLEEAFEDFKRHFLEPVAIIAKGTRHDKRD